jgi:hypothetical protein
MDKHTERVVSDFLQLLVPMGQRCKIRDKLQVMKKLRLNVTIR